MKKRLNKSTYDKATKKEQLLYLQRRVSLKQQLIKIVKDEIFELKALIDIAEQGEDSP